MNNTEIPNSEASVTLSLLKAVASDENLTQRSAASELGVALGLVNTYLKRCVKKGLIKVRQAPANRYAYYLTPRGMQEKGRLTAEFLTQSLSLFRQAQQDYAQIFEICEQNNWQRIVFHGRGDLTSVALLFARNFDLKVCAIIDANTKGSAGYELPIFGSLNGLSDIDAHVITDLHNPQPLYDKLIRDMPEDRVLAPRLLDLVGSKQKKGRHKR